MKSHGKDWAALIACIAVCQLAGGIGSFFTSAAIPGWYAELLKPSWAPPDWVFGPVWITLYTLMGIALFLVWRERAKNRVTGLALYVFFLHLVLNALWSVLFFGLKSISGAFIEIMVLWGSILATMVLFWFVRRAAALLLLPYLAWVSSAVVLNYAILFLNT